MTAAARLLHFWTTRIQSLRLWMMRLVAWLATAAGCREMRIFAREDLRQLRRELRFMLVTRVAIDLQTGSFEPPKHRNSRNMPDIDNFLSRRCFMRHALRGLHIRSLADAGRIFDRIEIHVARVARNLRRCVKARGVYWTADVPARTCRAQDVVRAPDTS